MSRSRAAGFLASAVLDLACPRCAAPAATLTLLTSMVRYYICTNCGSTWSETYAPGVEPRQLVHGGARTGTLVGLRGHA